jgi:hypothetical protein
MNSVDAHPVDEAIDQLIQLVIADCLEQCSTMEVARIRLALQHPSLETQELLAEAHELIVEALEIGVVPLVNHTLGLD